MEENEYMVIEELPNGLGGGNNSRSPFLTLSKHIAINVKKKKKRDKSVRKKTEAVFFL